MENYQLSILNSQLAKPLSRLFSQVFGFNAPPEYYRRKYDTSYLGIGHICAVAMEGENAVGFIGCIPMKFMWQGKEVLAAQSTDLATLPSHRGRGIIKQLAEVSNRMMHDAGVQFLFALSGENNFEVLGPTGRVAPESMFRYHFKTGMPAVSKVAKRFRAVDGVYQNWVKGIFKKHLMPERAFPNSLIQEGWLTPLYTPEYFEYKTFAPNYVLDIHGTPVWVKVDGAMQVGALGAFEEKNFPKIVGALKALAARAGAGEVLFQTAPSTQLDFALSQIAPPLPSWKMDYFDLGVATSVARTGLLIPEKLKVDGEATSVATPPLLSPEKLKVNFADLDTF